MNESVMSSLINEQLFSVESYQSCYIWCLTIISATIVGLTGILPLFMLPYFIEHKYKDVPKYSHNLRLMLSFAVGGLLGDVFLHLLPEAWNYVLKARLESSNYQHSGFWNDPLLFLGFWVLIGLSTFVIIEMMFAFGAMIKENDCDINNFDSIFNWCEKWLQIIIRSILHEKDIKDKSLPKRKSNNIAGYLNLLANCIDNFAHGLAVAGSFLVGTKVGIVTTIAIIVHEVPHEFGDFAILMKSGFNKSEAFKAQISTASVGILGAIVALAAESTVNVSSKTAWILPFTAGGFLHVSLISILPDLMKEDNPWESLKQLILIAIGIAIMGLVNILVE